MVGVQVFVTPQQNASVCGTAIYTTTVYSILSVAFLCNSNTITIKMTSAIAIKVYYLFCASKYEVFLLYK